MRPEGARLEELHVSFAKEVGGPACLREEVPKGAATSVPDHPGMDETGRAMTRLNDLKKRFIENPKFREEYAWIGDEFTLIEALIRARTAANLTQVELARRVGTTPSLFCAEGANCCELLTSAHVPRRTK